MKSAAGPLEPEIRLRCVQIICFWLNKNLLFNLGFVFTKNQTCARFLSKEIIFYSCCVQLGKKKRSQTDLIYRFYLIYGLFLLMCTDLHYTYRLKIMKVESVP